MIGIRQGDFLVYPWKNGRPGHIAIVTTDKLIGTIDGASQAANRALQWVGKGVYGLGKGGLKPGREGPLDADGKCDCSGFVTWCWNIPRYDGKNWHNTSFIYSDALGKQRFYKLITPEEDIARIDIVHCHGPTKRPPAITQGKGLLWKKKNGIVCRPCLSI